MTQPGRSGIAVPHLDGDEMQLAGAITLGTLVESADGLPGALVAACRQELAMQSPELTLGELLVEGDGCSPVLTVLLALDAEVVLAAGGVSSLDELLEHRPAQGAGTTAAVRAGWATGVEYDQVCRPPETRPLVCVAVARPGPPGDPAFRVALGGYGARPVCPDVPILGDRYDIEAAAIAAGRAYVDAGDERAAAALRCEAAASMTRGLLTRLMR